MSESRGYEAGFRARPSTPVTFILLALNAAVYVFQYYVLRRIAPDYWVADRFTETFALSLDGLRAGHFWQLITYQFLHGGFLHIFLNSWAIFVFGRPVEAKLGAWRMLAVYFISGVAGGLLQMLGSWAWPSLFGTEGIIGASASAYGLMAAFVALFPAQRLLMLLFFVIPISMRATTLLRLAIWISLAGILYPFYQHLIDRYLPFAHEIDLMFVGIGHAAHLGGLVTGLLLTLWMRRGRRVPPVIGAGPKSSLNITASPD
jgi:membrane associated rhomboid family serine protease